MTIADSVWLATALLHREKSHASDFSVQEIIAKSLAARLVESYRPGLSVYCSKHCVANKSPNPVRDRILVETARGRRRLFRTGDPFHPDRQNGKIRPEKKDIPIEYQPVVDWYDQIYCKQGASSQSAPEVNTLHQFPTDLRSGDSGIAGLDGMRSETAFVGPEGTVVLPLHLRREMDLKEGACLSIYRENDHIVLLPITDEFIRKMRGSLKGHNLLEDREREHVIEKNR